jgi:tRNA U38,U39,U40 pseudouridine synthase TruA
MKKPTNKQIAKVFRDAIKYLGMSNHECDTDRMKNRWICMAIADAAKTDRMIDAATEIIHSRIEPHTLVTAWLERHAKIPYKSITVERAQAYRKRWLESLVAEFENK